MNDGYFGLRHPHDSGRRRIQHRRSFFCFQGAQELRDQKVECRRSLGLGNHIMDLDLCIECQANQASSTSDLASL
ncbi:unnamed protein product [Rhodiola kirilowii]